MSKTYRKWLIALVVLIGLFFIGAFLFQNILENKIRELVHEKIAAPNHFSYGQMELSLYPGSLIFRDVSSDLYLPEKSKNLHSETSEIRIEGISWLWLALFKKLEINRLYVESPILFLSGQPSNDTLIIPEKRNENGLNSVDIGHIYFKGGCFKILNNSTDSVAAMCADTFGLDVRGFYLSMSEKNTPFKTGKIDFSLRNLVFYDEENVHEISLKKVDISQTDSLITLAGLRVKPKYDGWEFFKHLKYKKDRLDFNLPDIKIQGWDFDKMLKGAFFARSATVNGFDLNVLSDANMPLDPNGYKPFPQEVLRKAKFGITLDSILVKQGKIAYSANMPGKTKTGSLVFDPVSAMFLNVTNDSARIAERPLMEVSISGDFDKKHRLTTQFFMDLASPVYAFSFKGHVSALPFTAFNDFLTPSAGIVFEGGIIKSMDYDINADHKIARGKLKLVYEELDFSILNQEKNKKSKFLSSIVDALFVKDENTKNTDGFREGEIYVERETQRSFFRFWWTAIQEGMKNSILKDFALKKIDKRADKKPK